MDSIEEFLATAARSTLEQVDDLVAAGARREPAYVTVPADSVRASLASRVQWLEGAIDGLGDGPERDLMATRLFSLRSAAERFSPATAEVTVPDFLVVP